MKGFIDNFTASLFRDNKGAFFPELQKNPKLYIIPRPRVLSWLQTLKNTQKNRAPDNGASTKGTAIPGEGKEKGEGLGRGGIRTTKLFLVTNSHADFANFLMEKTFGKEWRSLFEIVVYYAKKGRGFFSTNADFIKVDAKDPHKSSLRVKPKLGHTAECSYVEGNADTLTRLFQEHSQQTRNPPKPTPAPSSTQPAPSSSSSPPSSSSSPSSSSKKKKKKMKKRICYVGDHLHGDIVACRKHCDWATVYIVEEVSPNTALPESSVPKGFTPMLAPYTDNGSSSSSSSDEKNDNTNANGNKKIEKHAEDGDAAGKEGCGSGSGGGAGGGDGSDNGVGAHDKDERKKHEKKEGEKEKEKDETRRRMLMTYFGRLATDQADVMMPSVECMVPRSIQ